MYRVTIVILAVLFLFASAAMAAQADKASDKSVDMGAFTTEAMLMQIDGDQYQLAMWFPYEFYVEANLQDGSADRASIEKDTAFLKPYITIILQCSTEQEDGTSVYVAEKKVRARAVLKASDGSDILPLTNPPPMVSAAVAAMKEIMASEGDEGSANLHVLVFPNKGKDGKPLIDANNKGKLKLVLKADGKYKQTEFVWNTPFDAMKSAPPCLKCGEKVSTKWSFCPWCGEKLP